MAQILRHAEFQYTRQVRVEPRQFWGGRAEALVGVPEPIRYKDRIVGVVMYRDNTIIDVVREIDEDA